MDTVRSGMDWFEGIWNDPRSQRLVQKYKRHYKESFIWTLETGCLAFSSMIIYYILFSSDVKMRALDAVVIGLFLLGALAYFLSAKIFSLSDDYWTKLLKKANKWIFTSLSFIPGLYFAFQFEVFIIRFYLVVHIGASAYFLYKRYKEFELIPFVTGLGLSVVLGLIGPTIRGFFGLFGSGWFVVSCQGFFGGIVDVGLAVAFFMRLPEKYLPPSILCGLKVVKYLMFIVSWQTFFILMVFTTWRNLGAGTRTLIEVYKNKRDSETQDGSSEGQKKE